MGQNDSLGCFDFDFVIFYLALEEHENIICNSKVNYKRQFYGRIALTIS